MIAKPWAPAIRVLFRFVFAYLVLFIVPMPTVWLELVPWVGRRVFHVDVSVRHWQQAFNGGGDTTFHYVQLFCTLVLAVLACAVWTVLDRRRASYAQLHAGLRVVVRFLLAMAMFLYGAGKVIPDQFPRPPLENLVRPAGDFLPIELLWTSASYTIFTGVAEMLGGLLLTARRTTLAGALICIGVLGNVFMLNVGYDVTVKIFSFHLLAMAVFLAAPDLKRLADLLLFNRPVMPAALPPPLARPWLNHGVVAFRTVLVAVIAGLSLWLAFDNQTEHGDWARRPPLYGIWEVSEFEVNGSPRPPLLTDADRWRRLIVPQEGPLCIQLVDDSRRHYAMTLDAAKRTLAVTRRQDPAWNATLTYQEPESGALTLEGMFGDQTIRAKLRRIDDSQMPLVHQRFHWIHEPSTVD